MTDPDLALMPANVGLATENRIYIFSVGLATQPSTELGRSFVSNQRKRTIWVD